jgi:hypothetical protein
VRNPLAGVQLRRTVSVSGQTATVDLTGVATDPAPVLSEISAQLVWTLQQTLVSTVVVLVDGQPIHIPGIPTEQTVDDWTSFDPDALPTDAVGHYLDAGALRTVTTGEPAPGPAGKGAYGLGSAAVAADPRTGALTYLAGVRAEKGQATLFVGPYGGTLLPVVTAASLTAPTLPATRAEVWVVKDGSTVLRVPFGGKPQEVATPTLPGLGRALVLRLSPDGVRAAVVVDGPEGPTLYVGTVARAEDGTVALRDLRQVAPSLSRVVDVAWSSSRRLLVLAGDAGQDRIVPYEVGIDGFGLTAMTTSGLPSQPTAIAAAPLRQALVIAKGTVWQLAGGTWVTLVRGAEPLPGTAPFYPI